MKRHLGADPWDLVVECGSGLGVVARAQKCLKLNALAVAGLGILLILHKNLCFRVKPE